MPGGFRECSYERRHAFKIWVEFFINLVFLSKPVWSPALEYNWNWIFLVFRPFFCSKKMRFHIFKNSVYFFSGRMNHFRSSFFPRHCLNWIRSRAQPRQSPLLRRINWPRRESRPPRLRNGPFLDFLETRIKFQVQKMTRKSYKISRKNCRSGEKSWKSFTASWKLEKKIWSKKKRNCAILKNLFKKKKI